MVFYPLPNHHNECSIFRRRCNYMITFSRIIIILIEDSICWGPIRGPTRVYNGEVIVFLVGIAVIILVNLLIVQKEAEEMLSKGRRERKECRRCALKGMYWIALFFLLFIRWMTIAYSLSLSIDRSGRHTKKEKLVDMEEMSRLQWSPSTIAIALPFFHVSN